MMSDAYASNVCSMLCDEYLWSIQAVSSARDTQSIEGVSQSVMHYSFVIRFHEISLCVLSKLPFISIGFSAAFGLSPTN